MSTKFGLLTDFDLLKARTSTNTKPELVLSDRGRHLEQSIWCHIFAVFDPEWHVKNGDEVNIETGKSDGLKATHFSLVVQACKPGCYICYSALAVFSRNALYKSTFYFFLLTIDIDEIWFVDKFWPSEGKDINKYETGTSIERPRLSCIMC